MKLKETQSFDEVTKHSQRTWAANKIEFYGNEFWEFMKDHNFLLSFQCFMHKSTRFIMIICCLSSAGKELKVRRNGKNIVEKLTNRCWKVIVRETQTEVWRKTKAKKKLFHQIYRRKHFERILFKVLCLRWSIKDSKRGIVFRQNCCNRASKTSSRIPALLEFLHEGEWVSRSLTC